MRSASMLAGAIVAAVALSSCAGSSHEVVTVSTKGPKVVAALRSAADQTSTYSSGKFTESLQLTGSTNLPTPQLVHGSFDTAHKAAQIDLGAAFGMPGKETMLTYDGAMYIQMPIDLPSGKSWIEVDVPAAEGSSSLGGAGADPTALLNQLQGESDGTTVVGHDRIDGIDCTHYRATVTLSKALAKLPPGAQQDLRGAMSSGLVGEALQKVLDQPRLVDVWVGNGVVQKLTQVAKVNGNEVKVTERFLDLGQPVTISPPSASETLRMNSLTEFEQYVTSHLHIGGN